MTSRRELRENRYINIQELSENLSSIESEQEHLNRVRTKLRDQDLSNIEDYPRVELRVMSVSGEASNINFKTYPDFKLHKDNVYDLLNKYIRELGERITQYRKEMQWEIEGVQILWEQQEQDETY